jgi:hypothetical protein
MSAFIDCPICMDHIESNAKNCVTTECGHCFHTNCLMRSVAHNGFGCPYCRTAMAEVPDDEETIYSDYYEDYEEDIIDDNALRGFRFFWNLLNGEEHDEDDDSDEQQLEEWGESAEAQYRTPANYIPTSNFVAQKLIEKGITFEQIVDAALFHHDEYMDNEESNKTNGKIFGVIRSILYNYRREQHLQYVSQIQAQIQAPNSTRHNDRSN